MTLVLAFPDSIVIFTSVHPTSLGNIDFDSKLVNHRIGQPWSKKRVARTAAFRASSYNNQLDSISRALEVKNCNSNNNNNNNNNNNKNNSQPSKTDLSQPFLCSFRFH